LAAGVDVDRRDAGDAVGLSDLRVLVGVELDDLELVAPLLRELLEDGCDHLAGAAPGCPEVDEDRPVVLQDVLGERRVAGLCGGHGGFLPPGTWAVLQEGTWEVCQTVWGRAAR